VVAVATCFITNRIPFNDSGVDVEDILDIVSPARDEKDPLDG
jgi:hypothetical protein